MHTFIAWCGFVGAWLLVAGPLRQAGRELDAGRRAVGAASFHDKAATWMFVSGGAFLIAVKETWELHEAAEWSEVVFWVLVFAMGAICVGNAIASTIQRQARERRERSDPGDGG